MDCFIRGQRIILELINMEIIEGDFVVGSKDHIDLSEISEYPFDTKMHGTFTFYRSEINNVRLKANKESIELPATLQVESNLPADTVFARHEDPQKPAIELSRLLRMADDFIYISCRDRHFWKAIDYLSNRESVGVVGMCNTNDNELILLVLAAWDQVYIFDIISFDKELPTEVKSILESNLINKVIHDGRPLVDCLERSYNTTINKLSDTCIGDFMLQYKYSGTLPQSLRPVGECLWQYLCVPVYILQKIKDKSPQKWAGRPLSEKKKLNASLRATYLITLRNVMDYYMLSEYNAMVIKHSNLLSDLSLSEKLSFQSTDRFLSKPDPSDPSHV